MTIPKMILVFKMMVKVGTNLISRVLTITKWSTKTYWK